MSLVAYGSSDESSDDEENRSVAEPGNSKDEIANQHTPMRLPSPKQCTVSKYREEEDVAYSNGNVSNEEPERIHFDTLPEPKSASSDRSVVEEDDIPPRKEIEMHPEKPVKKDRGPVRITVPSLSEFKDLEEEEEKQHKRIQPSKKGTGLFAVLPPPKAETKGKDTLVPSVIAKASEKPKQIQSQHTRKTEIKAVNPAPVVKAVLNVANYDSHSEDEEDDAMSSKGSSSTDFFSLTDNEPILPIKSEALAVASSSNTKDKVPVAGSSSESSKPDKTLVSTVMNLPKEEILLKNKAEVGPKLPVPEQEYNVDDEGNVAFDEKAIEYLCGRRSVKRKQKEIDEANIIEINGEDIKPDEREWLVKALTEEPVQRPISMQSFGVNSQSKKKHQITYLAHQAKAMEMELKNQWAQNRLTRKQTQSKYGF